MACSEAIKLFQKQSAMSSTMKRIAENLFNKQNICNEIEAINSCFLEDNSFIDLSKEMKMILSLRQLIYIIHKKYIREKN